MTAPPSLAQRTTLRVGGPAHDWVTARTESQLVDAVRSADEAGTPVLILGGGSNLLVADAGFPGTVIQVALKGMQVTDGPELIVLEVMAGERWDEIVSYCVDHGWSGIEALSGIPGLAGATPIQNVGAYGQEVAEVILGVRVLDRRTGAIGVMEPEACGFGYRTSVFKQQPGRWVILAVTLQLHTRGSGEVRYAELARTLGAEIGGSVGSAEIRAAVMLLRRGKGMVLDEGDHDTWSAGSFFTNPIVEADVAARLPEACPRYPAAAGVKLSAAWLIENSGIPKGFSLQPDAPAAISAKHTLALTNRGSAHARDIMELAGEVQRRVYAAHGIQLAIEPTLAGFPG